MRYVAGAAGSEHTVMIRSDGFAVACGWNVDGQCNVPDLPAGMRYVAAAAKGNQTVLIRSDGSAVAFGCNWKGACNIEALPARMRYVAVSAGGFHTLLFRNDGKVLACGDNGHGRCVVPQLLAGAEYVPPDTRSVIWSPHLHQWFSPASRAIVITVLLSFRSRFGMLSLDISVQILAFALPRAFVPRLL
jgi:hypothetical protein